MLNLKKLIRYYFNAVHSPVNQKTNILQALLFMHISKYDLTLNNI